MTKQNKVLEALEKVRKRIKTEVSYWKRADGGEIYEATGINKILQEEKTQELRRRSNISWKKIQR